MFFNKRNSLFNCEESDVFNGEVGPLVLPEWVLFCDDLKMKSWGKERVNESLLKAKWHMHVHVLLSPKI